MKISYEASVHVLRMMVELGCDVSAIVIRRVFNSSLSNNEFDVCCSQLLIK